MPLLSPRLSGATSLAVRREEATQAATLEFQSPSAAIVAAPVPRAARGVILAITGMFAAWLAASGPSRLIAMREMPQSLNR